MRIYNVTGESFDNVSPEYQQRHNHSHAFYLVFIVINFID